MAFLKKNFFGKFFIRSSASPVKKGNSGLSAKEFFAQSATELAIFGAILVFVIGLIVRSGLQQSHGQNAQLRALRMALTESYRTGEGQYSPNPFNQPSASRNYASVLLIEDRLSLDASSKYPTRDRFPIFASGSGSFSRNLFLPVELGEDYNLPLSDVIVNGQRFPFTTAGFDQIVLANPDGSQPAGMPLCGTPGVSVCWEPNCFNNAAPPPPPPAPPPAPATSGCAVLYEIIGNYSASEEWCDTDPCSGNIPTDERFDLNFDGTPDVPDPLTDEPSRSEFGWQWVKVAAVSNSNASNLALGPGVEGIRVCTPDDDDCEPINVLLDVDGDFKEESLLKMQTGPGGVITILDYRDAQEGDIDFTIDDRDQALRVANGLEPLTVGLQDDLQMFSFTDEGLLKVEEGQLFNPLTGQYVRQASAHQHLDIIQRTIQITKDTNRFCDAGIPSVPTDWSAVDPVTGLPVVQGVSGLTNPVEACNNCFSVSGNPDDNDSYFNVEQTCLDQGLLIIFVRSRIEDIRGRRWVTRPYGN